MVGDSKSVCGVLILPRKSTMKYYARIPNKLVPRLILPFTCVNSICIPFSYKLNKLRSVGANIFFLQYFQLADANNEKPDIFVAILIVTELLFLDPHNKPEPDVTADSFVILYHGDNINAEKELRTDDEIKSTIAEVTLKALHKAYPLVSHLKSDKGVYELQICATELVNFAVETMHLKPEEGTPKESISLHLIASNRINVPFIDRKFQLGGFTQFELWRKINQHYTRLLHLNRKHLDKL